MSHTEGEPVETKPLSRKAGGLSFGGREERVQRLFLRASV
jgi:hypothetical protein